MKASLLIITTVFLFSLTPQDPAVSKQLEDYIKLTVDNIKTYEPVETRPAKSSDLFDSPEINGQFVIVENQAARINYILEDIHEFSHPYLPDSTGKQIIEIKNL